MKWDLVPRQCAARNCKILIRVLPTSKWFSCRWHEASELSWRQTEKLEAERAKAALKKVFDRCEQLIADGVLKKDLAAHLNKEGFRKLCGVFKGDPLDTPYVNKLRDRHEKKQAKIYSSKLSK